MFIEQHEHTNLNEPAALTERESSLYYTFYQGEGGLALDYMTYVPKSEASFVQFCKRSQNLYENAPDRRAKDLILSTVANIVPYANIILFIPGLSSRKFYRAKIIAKRMAKEIVKESAVHRVRYEPVRVNYFVEFLTSQYVTIGLPYGERNAKMSTGEKVTISNTLRLYRNSEIIRMFKKHMQAFVDVEQLVRKLFSTALIDKLTYDSLKLSIAQVRQYLRTDYKMHTKEESKASSLLSQKYANPQVADHCFQWALSDPKESDFQYSGPQHDHNLRCPRCELLDTTLKEVDSVLESVQSELAEDHAMKKEVAEMMHRMKDNQEKIYEMKRHLLRGTFTSQQREQIIQNLKKNEAFITLDYAQKYLASFSRETQKQYFGKAGMSYHVSHVLVNVSGSYVQHSFVHVLRTSKQDALSILQMLDHLLPKLKIMGISSVHIGADNAPAYHCPKLISSLPAISERSSVKIQSMSFSEAQTGKSSCDRVAATIKRKLRDFIDAKNGIPNELAMWTAISQAGIRGLSVYLANVIRSAADVEGHTKIDNMADYSHFEYDDNSVRFWKFHGIGPGRVIDDLSELGGERLQVEKEGGNLASAHCAVKDKAALKIAGSEPKCFWHAYGPTKSRVSPAPDNEPNDTDEIPSDEQKEDGKETDASPEDLHSCEECGASFVDKRNLIKHVDTAAHKIRPEKLNIYDVALSLYKRKLEDYQEGSILKEINDEAANLLTTSSSAQAEGWAMKRKRPHVRHSDNAKIFLTELFDQGVKSGRKFDPTEAARLMIENDNILPSERLTAQQIKSFFSTLCRKREKEGAARKRREISHECEILEDEDDLNSKDVGMQQDDAILEIIHQFKDELFLDTDSPWFDSDV